MKILLLLTVLSAQLFFAETLTSRSPTLKKTEDFEAQFAKSGFLKKNHTIKEIKAGKAFQIIPRAVLSHRFRRCLDSHLQTGPEDSILPVPARKWLSPDPFRQIWVDLSIPQP